MSWLSKVFELNPARLNWPRATMILNVLQVPLVVLRAIGYEQYLLSAVVGVLFAALVAAFTVTLAACRRAGTDAYPAKLACRWPNAVGKGVWFSTW